MPFIKQKIYTSPKSQADRFYGTKEYPFILYYFRKTPKSIVCPHFWELRWAYGCPYDCAYCYLQGTFRGNKRPRYIPIEHVLKALDEAFKDETLEPAVFNSGELADSLMNPGIMERIADKFEEQSRHKLLLLTKGVHDLSRVNFLVERPRRQTILSLSLNVANVWRLWEHLTPSPERRIELAKMGMEAGYEVRIRIDPIFPIEDWKENYGDLIYSLLSGLPSDPDRITLGTPRGLAKTLKFARDKTWELVGFTDNPEQTKWGKKAPEPLRREIYLFFYDKLCALGFDKSKIAMCKETVSMWENLGIDWRKFKCNCVW